MLLDMLLCFSTYSLKENKDITKNIQHQYPGTDNEYHEFEIQSWREGRPFSTKSLLTLPRNKSMV